MRARRVLVAGAGVSGRSAAAALVADGAEVVVTDANRERLDALGLPGVRTAAGLGEPPEGTELVVTSPGWRPDAPLLAAAAGAGIEVIGEVELAWRMDQDRPGGPARWLAVTGTNGKTTTVGMLESILRAAGLDAVACGNVGLPVVDAVRAGHAVLAVELSSFQLYWSPSVRPHAGAVLNVAEDHLDWHGSMEAYAQAKAQVLTGAVAVAGVDDPWAASLLAESPAPRKIGFTLAEPARGQLGVLAGQLVDRTAGVGAAPADAEPAGEEAVPADPTAVPAGGGTVLAADAVPATGAVPTDGGTGRAGGGAVSVDRTAVPTDGGAVLAAVADVRPAGSIGLLNALAAAALAGAIGVPPEAVRAGLRAFEPGEHRGAVVREHRGVRYVDDSKATNPHAAAAALRAAPTAAHPQPGRVVWIAGGLLKGVAVDELVAGNAHRLAGVVLIGADRAEIAAALARHAPDVPVREVSSGDDGAMIEAVRGAAELAQPGDVVLLAPAAASMDMFTDYKHRGDAFANAVRGLP